MANSIDTATLNKHRAFLNKYGFSAVEKMDDETVLSLISQIEDAATNQAQVLSLGQMEDTSRRLLGYVPNDMEGQWMLNTPTTIALAEGLGWKVFEREGGGDNASFASSGDGTVVLADCILMVMPRTKYIGSLLAKSRRLENRRNSRKADKIAKEETSGFTAPVKEIDGPGDDAINFGGVNAESGATDDDVSSNELK